MFDNRLTVENKGAQPDQGLVLNEIEASYPLSPMQQGMLFHSVSAPQPGVYVQQLICSLPEPLQSPLFLRAWEQVIARHAILRTSFRWDGLETPLQDVHSHAALSWRLSDWRKFAEREQQERVHAYLRADRQRGFDLTALPLMRLAIFRLADDHYQCVWTYHHALLDGRSRLIVMKEVFALYDAACQGQEASLPPSRPYQAYIAWLQQQDVAPAETFWRETLRGFTAPTPLLADHPAGTVTEHPSRNGEQEFVLSPELTSTLQTLAHENQLTMNTLLQGVWALLLSRYSGEDDVVFGATRACRRSVEEAERDVMLGLFINTLPVRVRVPEDTRLLPWLQELRAQQLMVRPYEHTPLSKIQEWSEARPPLFESLMIFERHRIVDASLRMQEETQGRRTFALREQTSYPLTFAGYDGPELLLTIEYDRGRFADATIGRMLGHLRTMLESIAVDPHQRLADIPSLTEAERRQLLLDWNDTAQPYPHDACIHQLFETQAERTPEGIAIEREEKRLTYAELDQRANQLARYLQKLGVGPETLVALCVDRSVEMAIGVLGVLKAGGAYAPLDPMDPKERLAFILEDAQTPVLVTQQHLLDALPPCSARVVFLDADWPVIAHEPTTAPASGVTADHLAYVIYTSGSTGKPKGALISHRAVVNHCTAIMKQFALQPQDRTLQFACISFDASVEEIFPAWASGATLILRSQDILASVMDFLRVIEQQRISVLNLPTAFWHELVYGLTQTNAKLPPTVRLVIVGGEKASSSALAKWLQLEGQRIRWINTYGPTEATVTATTYEPAPSTIDWDPHREIPIGRPLANAQAYILDKAYRPVPIGVAGELYIGGVGLARGYLRRPELTAEKFIAHPFSAEPGARLYQTGDRVRYLPDGNIEFLGRVDHQVKLRGLRIELGEIEALLSQHPAVRAAAVLARENAAGDKLLVGYIVPQAQQTPTTHELREFLTERLPAYMTPTTFVALNAFPMTPSGKVDRRALPAPASAAVVEQDTVHPRDEYERLLVQIWEELFPGRSIGIHDNFFAVGGHSLLAIRMLSKVQQRTGKRLPLASLFKEGTIARLASLLRQSGQQPHSCLVGIQPQGTRPPFFCVHGAGGGVFWYNDLAHRLGAAQPFYGIESPGVEDSAAIDTSIETLASQYIEAIQTVQPQGPYFLGGYSMGGIVAFEMARQLHAHGQTVALLAVFDTWGPGSHLTRRELILRLVSRFWNMSRSEKGRFLRAKADWLTRSLREWRLVGVLNRHIWRLRRLKKANIQAVRAYTPRQYAGALTLLRARTQRTTASSDPSLGWKQFVTGGIDIHEIPGDHYSMFAFPNSQILAERLHLCLAQAQRRY